VLAGARLKQLAEIRIRFTALRLEHRVELRDPSQGRAPQPVLAAYLQPDRMIPLDGVIGEISQQQTGLTDPLAKARRLYDYVLAHMRYENPPQNGQPLNFLHLLRGNRREGIQRGQVGIFLPRSGALVPHPALHRQD